MQPTPKGTDPESYGHYCLYINNISCYSVCTLYVISIVIYINILILLILYIYNGPYFLRTSVKFAVGPYSIAMLLYFLRCLPPFFGVPTVLFTMPPIRLVQAEGLACSSRRIRLVLIICVYIILYIHCLLQPIFLLFVYTMPDRLSSISYFFVVFYYICGCVCGGHFFISTPSPLNILKSGAFQRVKYAKNRKATLILSEGSYLQALSQRYRNAIVNEKTKLPLDKLVKVWYTTS